MASYPIARAASRSFDFPASAISFGMLAFASATLWAGASQPARAQQKGGKSVPFDRGKSTIATAHWFGESLGEDVTTTAVCVKDDGSYVCLIPTDSEGKNHLTLTIDGIERDSEILSIDPVSRVCLAKANMSEVAEPVALSDGQKLTPGGALILLNTGETARLAGIDRQYLGETLPTSMLRVHLSEKRSDCIGQPIFCPLGKLAGLLTDRELADEHEAHAVPAARISRIIADFENEKPTGRIWIGASFHRQSTTPEVVTVTPNSPAEKAGLQPGDIVVKVDEKSVSSLPELAAVCETMVDGEPIILSILRRLEVIERELIPRVVVAKSAESEKK